MGRRTVVALLGLLTGIATREAAAADTTVGVDVGTQLLAVDGDAASPTFGLRVGKELDLQVARFVPEAGLVGIPSTSFVGVIGGARLTFLRLVEPGAYAHAGYGGTVGDPGWLMLDGGLLVDLVVPHFRVGVHGGGEVRKNASGVTPIVVAGVHTAVKF
jgi:hypothetical protein